MNDSKYAARDPAIEAALADLGVGRRDFISAFEGGNGLANARAERAEKLRAREEADNRRTSREQAAAKGDGLAVQLTAWNDPSRFEADPFALHSEDIGGGQSHRARLRQARESGQLRDWDEPRRGRVVGEERAQYLQSRNVSGTNGNYVAVAGANTGPNGARRTVSSATPRAAGLQSAPIPTNSSSGRAPPPRPSGHNRPPSPRSQGTVRFGAGGRTTERPSSSTQNGQPRTASVRPILRGLAAAGLAAAPRPAPASSALPRKTSAASSSANRPVAAATPSVPRPAVSTAPPSTATKAPAAPPGLPQNAPNKNTLHQPEDYIQRAVMQNKALLYAATPGAACDNFENSNPEAARYLHEARRRLVNEVTAMVKRGDEKEMKSYISAHQERMWMVLAAIKARELLDYASNSEIDAYYKQNVTHSSFLAAAHALDSSYAATPKSAATSPTTSSSATVVPAASSAAPPKAATSTSTNGVAAPPAQVSQQGTKMKSPIAIQASTSRPAQDTQDKDRAARSAVLAASTTASTYADRSTRTSTANTISASSSYNDRAARISAVASSTSAPLRPPPGLQVPSANEETPQVNGSVSTASSRDSLRSVATDITIPPKRGALNVTLLSANGNFLGHEQVAVDAPVNGTMTLTSTSADYDPRKFVEALKNLVEHEVVKHIQHAESVAKVHDGIWDSDEEL